MKRRNGLAPILVFCILTLCFSAVRGQENRAPLPQPLTKDAAVEYALAHNRIFKAAGEDLAAAVQRVKQAQADFYPKLDASYAFRQFSDQPTVTLGVMGGQTFPFAVKTSNRWEVNLVQPLFTGFFLESQYKINKAGRQLSSYQMEEVRLNLVRDVQAAYLQALLGARLLDVARETVASLEVERRNAEANYKQGVAAVNDVLKADVALADAGQRERHLAKQLVILRSTLNQLMDVDLQEKVELADIEEKTYTFPDLHELYMMAEQTRPEYLAMATSIKQADYGKTAARSRYYPRVSAFVQYFREGEDFPADNNPFTNNENTAVGVRVDWNLFEGGKTRASELEWEHRRRAIEQRRGDFRQQIRLQVENAFEQLKVAKTNIETSRVALRQAEENERITTLQYKEQTVIFLEVLNAQVFVAQTKADFYQALYGYEIAKADLERATGGPLGK
ncbi:MAG: TolC family protein [Syntrophobacteraceae bacterium]